MRMQVNPMKGYSNSPYLVIEGIAHRHFNDLYYYHPEGCYWTQNQGNGSTDFLWHGGEWELIGKKHGLPYYQTLKSDGFGGCTFPLRVQREVKKGETEICFVDVRGPWSGGCYCTNHILPKQATEVTYRESQFSFIASNLTIERVNTLLKEFLPRWKCILVEKHSSKLWPELHYEQKEGSNIFLKKERWEAETESTLDAAWKRFYQGSETPMQSRGY